jgi:anti-anti-sigma regulatory factor
MDSSGLGELVKAHHRARRENGRLVLIQDEGSIARILAAAGVEDTIETGRRSPTLRLTSSGEGFLALRDCGTLW